jgi:hypothetical protein
MKRSPAISLILIASASLVACGPDYQETKREIYATRDKCEEDWGDSKNCEEEATPAGRRYYGPRYFFSHGYPHYYPPGGRDPAPVTSEAGFSRVAEGAKSPRSISSLSSRVVRGGFGKSAGVHGVSS